MARAVSRTQISNKKKKLFLRLLAETGGNVMESALAVGYANPAYLLKVRRDDEDFAKEWEDAVQAGCAVLEAEANRRAIEGVLEPVFHKGIICGYKTNYSDALLMFRLKKMDPAYRESRNGGDTNINFGIAVLPMTAKNEDDWETRAVIMHDDQAVVELEAKPTDIIVEKRIEKVTRGD